MCFKEWDLFGGEKNSGAKARENPQLIFFLFVLLYYLNVLDFNCRTCQFHTVFGRVIAQWHNLIIKKSTRPLELA